MDYGPPSPGEDDNMLLRFSGMDLAHKDCSHEVQGAAQGLAWSQTTLGRAPVARSLRGIINLAMPRYNATSVIVIMTVKRQR